VSGRGLLLLFLGLVALLGLGAEPARACDADGEHGFGISPGCVDLRISGTPTTTDAAPDFFQAGGHPHEVVTVIKLNAPAEDDPVHGPYWPAEPVRNMEISLSPGLVANLGVVPACTREQLEGSNEKAECPPDSQVGLATISFPFFGILFALKLPLFRVAAPAGVPVRFGFNALGSASVIDAAIRPAGELLMRARKMTELLPIASMSVGLWGVPADPSHDPQRACPGETPPTGSLAGSGPSCPAGVPPRAFLRLPTTCAEPAALSVGVDSWLSPGEVQSTSVVAHRSPGLLGDPAAPGSYPAPHPGLAATQWGPPQAFTGCDRLPFAPSLALRPTSQAASSPTGLDLEVSFPQQGLEDPAAVAEADLAEGAISLPPELSLNPAVANGLSACTPEQVGLESSEEARCPDSSKLGTVEMASPLLSTPLSGSIYIASREAGRGGGATLPAYLVASGSGLVIKLLSEMEVDPGDGSVTARFDDVPEVPIERLTMRFFGGERAPFATPVTCGRYGVTGRFVPHSGTAAVLASDAFEITAGPAASPCPSDSRARPFAPGFRAGTTKSLAGATSALVVKLTRQDGEQEPSSFELSMPAGLAANLAGVPVCPEAGIAAAAGRAAAAELADPSCPAASRVGGASVSVGVGSEPFHLNTGQLYLAGPHGGARYSLVLVLPALAGPIDLGTAAMRMPLRPDPSDGHLALKSELPALQGGVRLNLRQLALQVDRPGFLTNPTNCRPATIGGRIGGDAGATAIVSSPFQIRRCGSLGFKPGLRMKVLGGRAATRHGSHPSLRTVLTPRRGDANFRRASILFAASAQLDPANMRDICSRAAFAAGTCPRGSVYGHIKALSPLLDKALRGPLRLRQSSGQLPDLVASLHGAFDLELTARIGFAHGRMRVILDEIPDVAISKLVLTTLGGDKGLLVNNRNLCEAPSFTTVAMTAQNGRQVERQRRLAVPCRAG
jgi:hypothetical protein